MSVAPARRRALRIGPEHHGRRMSLGAFAHAESKAGYLYELEKGVVVVVDVPGIPHSRIVRLVRSVLEFFAAQYPGRINHIAGATDSVLRMPQEQSERHPDVAVYLSPPPSDDEQAWDDWTPDILIEVVSKSSRKRDYEIKPAEYLAAGARQYWIIDPLTRSATILVRRADTWRKTKRDLRGVIRTALLPGFELRLEEVFAVLG